MMKSFVVSLTVLSLVTPTAAVFAEDGAGVNGSFSSSGKVEIDDSVSDAAKIEAAKCAQNCAIKMNALDIKVCLERCALPIMKRERGDDSSDGVAIPKFLNVTSEAKRAAEKADVGALRAGLQDLKDSRRDSIEDLNDDRRSGLDDLKEIRESGDRDAFVKARAEFELKMKASREELKTKLEDSRKALLEKIKGFKDERKKETTERIYTNLNEVNKKVTTEMTENLGKISEFLVKLSDRATTAATNGKDVVSAKAQIVAAQTAVATAQAAVTVQAGKTYNVNVTTEANLQVATKAVRDQLYVDLKATRETVKAARDAAQKAAVTLAQSLGVTATVNASTSASSTQ